MRDNPIQFAVVREDPNIDLEVVNRFGAQRVFLIASGGCTALSLSAARPELELTLLDPNPAQLDLIRRKLDALSTLEHATLRTRFNIGTTSPTGLSECGNFESLFRNLRQFVYEFVVPRDEITWWFRDPDALGDVAERVFDHPYWPVAFELYFSDPLLLAMFGPDAIQYAVPHSYPGYFRALFERGLTRGDAVDNPFLHHVWLGHYLDRPGCRPTFLETPPTPGRIELIHGFVDDQVTLDTYDLVGLSNILDWMSPEDVEALMAKVRRELRPGGVVLWRQLNNTRDLERHLKPDFTFDPHWNRSLWDRDRSLFYSSIHVGRRRDPHSDPEIP